MKKTKSNVGETKITVSYTGKLSTGNYQNEQPWFGIEQDVGKLSDEALVKRLDELFELCRGRFNMVASRINAEVIEKLYQNIRFYEDGGIKKPSVTSIINDQKEWFMTPDEAAQYKAVGRIKHKVIEIFLTTGEWKDPMTINEILPDIVVVKTGNLQLDYNQNNFREFYAMYPFKVLATELTVYGSDYAGTLDIIGAVQSSNSGKWPKETPLDTPLIMDVKTSVDKISAFTQMYAYSNCKPQGLEITHGAIIPINNETQQGFSKPIVEELGKFKSLWEQKLKDFKKRYGL